MNDNSLILSTETLASIANLAAFAGDGKEVPILAGIRIDVADGSLTAVATDRYTVGRYRKSDVEGNFHAIIGASFISQVAKLAKSSKAMLVTVKHDVDSGIVTMDWGSATASTSEMTGNWPPVERLFTDDQDSDLPPGIRFNPNFLARLAKLVDVTRSKPADRMIPFAFYSAPGNDPAKPRPILARADEFGYDALIQPIMSRR